MAAHYVALRPPLGGRTRLVIIIKKICSARHRIHTRPRNWTIAVCTWSKSGRTICGGITRPWPWLWPVTFKWATWLWLRSLRGSLSLFGWYLSWSTYAPNLKCFAFQREGEGPKFKKVGHVTHVTLVVKVGRKTSWHLLLCYLYPVHNPCSWQGWS